MQLWRKRTDHRLDISHTEECGRMVEEDKADIQEGSAAHACERAPAPCAAPTHSLYPCAAASQ